MISVEMSLVRSRSKHY